MIGTTVKVGFDSSRVSKGFQNVQTGFKKLGSVGAKAGKAMAAPFIKLMAVLAPILGVAGMGKGIKSILDYGGAVSDLAARSGLAAGEIVVLQEVFRRTGLEADKVATVLQRMGRRTYQGVIKETGEYADALKVLNLRNEELLELNLADRFELIAGKIGELKDASIQADVAMKLFGDDGFKLINTFKDGNAFDVARESAGGLVETIDKIAPKADHVSDALGAVGLKLKQFFAGLAVEIMPMLTKMADFINEIDLTRFGTMVGEFMNLLKAAWETGNLGRLITDSLIYAAKRFGEVLLGAFNYATQQAIEKMAEAGVPGVKSKTDAKLVATPNKLFGVTLPGGFEYVKGSPLQSAGKMMEDAKGVFGSNDALRKLGETKSDIKQAAWLEKIGWYSESMEGHMKSIDRKTKPNTAPTF